MVQMVMMRGMLVGTVRVNGRTHVRRQRNTVNMKMKMRCVTAWTVTKAVRYVDHEVSWYVIMVTRYV